MLTGGALVYWRVALSELGFPADEWDDARVEDAAGLVLDLERQLDRIGHVSPDRPGFIANTLEFILSIDFNALGIPARLLEHDPDTAYPSADFRSLLT